MLQWLFWQAGGLGPMAGQRSHFVNLQRAKIDYALERYGNEYDRLLAVMDVRLRDREYLAGDYSIADIASFPWVRPYRRLGNDLAKFDHLRRWYDALKARPAVRAGIDLGKDLAAQRAARPGRPRAPVRAECRDRVSCGRGGQAMKFFDCPQAPSPRRVRICIAEKGLEIDTVMINLESGEQFGEAFRRINPDCVVPALELDDGSVLTEALAISDYLDHLHPEPPLFGNTPAERAHVIEWNAKAEQQGLAAVAEAFRNYARGMRERSVTGPVNYHRFPS